MPHALGRISTLSDLFPRWFVGIQAIPSPYEQQELWGLLLSGGVSSASEFPLRSAQVGTEPQI